MDLAPEVVSAFAKISVAEENKYTPDVTYINGKIVLSNGNKYVQFDGSDQFTPVESFLCGANQGDRVTCQIKNHSVIVTGNITDPSANQGTVDNLDKQITEFGTVVADKVSTKDFEAAVANIDQLTADNVTIKQQLTASSADISDLKAKDVEITGDLQAANAEIDKLHTDKLDVDVANAKYATIENLDATNADIRNLNADYGDFKQLTTNQFAASDAVITDLKANMLTAESADLKYANIDFTNIGKAAIENFFSKSGMIGDLVVGEGTITGTLVGVTIKGDLIEGGTVKADKLVVKGSDGLYYKLNTDGETVEAQQTDQNSLNGSIITAKSITATKISVSDLVAFDATIGGFNITDDSIYSGVKESVDNTTRGIYLDNTGQVAFGDDRNYLKYFKDTDGSWKLDLSAQNIKLSSGANVEDVMNNTIVDSTEEFYISTSRTELEGGTWSEDASGWTDGTYIWRRTRVTRGNGEVSYSPSENGICISGNDGDSSQVDIEVGARNLVLNSDSQASNSQYKVAEFGLSRKMVAGEKYVVQIWGTLGDGKDSFDVYLGNTEGKLASLSPVEVGKYQAKFTGVASASEITSDTLCVYAYPESVSSQSTIEEIKMEIGTTATDWSPAPEDFSTNLDSLNTTVNGEGGLTETVATTKASLELLEDSLKSTVVEGTKETVLEQTADGWVFKIGSVTGGIQDEIDAAKSAAQDAKDTAQDVKDATDAIAEKTAYINIGDPNSDDPVLELGKTDSEFKVQITNTAMNFLQKGVPIAYITNQSLYITASTVTNELQIGEDPGFIWKKRANGNLGLRKS